MLKNQTLVQVCFQHDGEPQKETWALLLEEHEYLALRLTQEDPGFSILKVGYLETIIKRKTDFEKISFAEYQGKAPRGVTFQSKMEFLDFDLEELDIFHLAGDLALTPV